MILSIFIAEQLSLDANTIKLEQGGLVALAGVQTPQMGGFPECSSAAPSRQLQKLLPAKSSVQVRYLVPKDDTSTSNSIPRVLLVLGSGEEVRLVNAELIQSGYAKPVPRGRQAAEEALPGFTQALIELNQQAKQQQLGLYQVCSSSSGQSALVDAKSKTINSNSNSNIVQISNTAVVNMQEQFEPIKYTTQTKWGIDGGKTVRVANEDTTKAVPKNPGDRVGCSDFDTYEDALKYYETYQPYYGDVAKLDRDGDGVPCPKLPHTKNMDKFRRKVPTTSIGYGGQ